MRHIEKALVLLSLIGMTAIGSWSWSRHQTDPAQMPPQVDTVGTQEPLHENFASSITTASNASERARAPATRKNANDVESVTRTFKEASDCLLYHGARRELHGILNDERLDDLSRETLATLQNLDATSSRYLSIVRKTEASCIGSDRDALAQVYTDAILKAALLGNPDAEVCFVISPSQLRNTSAEVSETLEDRYLKYAPVFTQNALERGDPYIAARALYRYVAASPSRHPTRVDAMRKADPLLTWRAARLASLRALPEQRARLEKILEHLKEQNMLPPDEMQRADAWAKATYDRDFNGQPPINLDAHTPCYSSPDLAT